MDHATTHAAPRLWRAEGSGHMLWFQKLRVVLFPHSGHLQWATVLLHCSVALEITPGLHLWGEVRAVRTLTPLTERNEFKVQLSVVVQTGPWAHTQLLVGSP